MKPWGISIWDWPRSIAANCVGYVALCLLQNGFEDAGMRVAKVSHWLWEGI